MSRHILTGFPAVSSSPLITRARLKNKILLSFFEDVISFQFPFSTKTGMFFVLMGVSILPNFYVKKFLIHVSTCSKKNCGFSCHIYVFHRYQGKQALVGEAIKQARGKLLTEVSGMTNQVVFILAGQPADDAKQLFKEAMKLKKEGEWIILNSGEYSRPY